MNTYEFNKKYPEAINTTLDTVVFQIDRQFIRHENKVIIKVLINIENNIFSDSIKLHNHKDLINDLDKMADNLIPQMKLNVLKKMLNYQQQDL